MKNLESTVVTSEEPTEDEIRDYAEHLYQQSGCLPGRDLDNWLEAKACLEANIPKEHAHRRLVLHQRAEELATGTTASGGTAPSFRGSDRSTQNAGTVMLRSPSEGRAAGTRTP
jgi:hypothetical protein